MYQTDLIIFLTWCKDFKISSWPSSKNSDESFANFAHPKNLVLGMFCEDEDVHQIAANKIQCITKNSHYHGQIIKY